MLRGPMRIQFFEPYWVEPRSRFTTNKHSAPMPMARRYFATRSRSFMNQMRKQKIPTPKIMAISWVRAVPRSKAASRLIPIPESR